MSTLAAAQVAVTNGETTIAAADAQRQRITIVNRQTVPVFIGPTGLSTSSGFMLDPGAAIDLAASCAVYGITSAAYTGVWDALVQYVEETSA